MYSSSSLFLEPLPSQISSFVISFFLLHIYFYRDNGKAGQRDGALRQLDKRGWGVARRSGEDK